MTFVVFPRWYWITLPLVALVAVAILIPYLVLKLAEQW